MTASTGTIAAIVLSIAFACLLVAAYAGFAGWPVWAILLVAAPLALNRANARAMSKDNSGSRLIAALLAGFPIALLFSAMSYAIGWGSQKLITMMGG